MQEHNLGGGRGEGRMSERMERNWREEREDRRMGEERDIRGR